MEVVKKGRPQRGWSKEYKGTGAGNGQGGCGAILLISEYDLYQTVSEHYDGSTDCYTTFCCCECGVETDVKDVPVNQKGIRPSEEEREKIALKISSSQAL